MEKVKAAWQVIKTAYNNLPIWFWKSLTPDNTSFLLHSPLTPIILVFTSILALFFDEINCFDLNENQQDYVWTRCLTIDTYQIPISVNDTSYDRDVPTLTSYYDWVPLLLIVQALFFFIPRFTFRHSGGETINRLVSHESIKELTSYAQWEKSERQIMAVLVKEVKSILGSDKNNVWVRSLFACDIFNLLNVIIQFLILHIFLYSTFTSFATSSDSETYKLIFPPVVNCKVTEVNYNNWCMFGQNGLFSGIFLFMWGWFILLGVATVFSIFQRAGRYLIFKLPAARSDIMLLLLGYCTLTPHTDDLNTVLARCQFSDLLMLNYLALHLDDSLFRKLMQCLANRKTTTPKVPVPVTVI